MEELQCLHCPEETFEQEAAFRGHQRNWHKYMKHICRHGGHRFQTEADLMEHYVTAHGLVVKEITIECVHHTPPKPFDTIGGLEDHYQRKHKDFKVKCKCHNKFATDALCAEHMASHS